MANEQPFPEEHRRTWLSRSGAWEASKVTLWQSRDGEGDGLEMQDEGEAEPQRMATFCRGGWWVGRPGMMDAAERSAPTRALRARPPDSSFSLSCSAHPEVPSYPVLSI